MNDETAVEGEWTPRGSAFQSHIAHGKEVQVAQKITLNLSINSCMSSTGSVGGYRLR